MPDQRPSFPHRSRTQHLEDGVGDCNTMLEKLDLVSVLVSKRGCWTGFLPTYYSRVTGGGGIPTAVASLAPVYRLAYCLRSRRRRRQSAHVDRCFNIASTKSKRMSQTSNSPAAPRLPRKPSHSHGSWLPRLLLVPTFLLHVIHVHLSTLLCHAVTSHD